MADVAHENSAARIGRLSGDQSGHTISGGSPLPFAAATALLAGLAVVLAVFAAGTTVRGDIA